MNRILDLTGDNVGVGNATPKQNQFNDIKALLQN